MNVATFHAYKYIIKMLCYYSAFVPILFAKDFLANSFLFVVLMLICAVDCISGLLLVFCYETVTVFVLNESRNHTFVFLCGQKFSFLALHSFISIFVKCRNLDKSKIQNKTKKNFKRKCQRF